MPISAPTARGPSRPLPARTVRGLSHRALLLAAALLGFGVAIGLPPAALAQPRTSVADASATANSALVRATIPPGDRNYTRLTEAILAADMDYIVTTARERAQENAALEPTAAMTLALDAFAARRFDEARGILAKLPDGPRGFSEAILEPYIFLAQGDPNAAVREMRARRTDLPEDLSGIAEALVLEAAGRPVEAAVAYSLVERTLNTEPYPRGKEPASAEEYLRLLDQGRTAHALYRSALTQHRIGRREEAARLYTLAAGFASESADLRDNQRRLQRRQPPREAPLDASRGLGRILFFVADVLGQEEGIQAYQRDPSLPDDLAAPRAMTLVQFALLLDPTAHDWLLGAAADLEGAGGLDGAARLLARVPASSVFAADANLALAELELERRRDPAAIAAARSALRAGSDRWSILLGVADVMRIAGEDQEAMRAVNRALALTQDPEDRSMVLFSRAFIHRFAGRLPEAAADARAANALDNSDTGRMLVVGLMMDNPDTWAESVSVGRQLLAELPDSVDRLNGLGYALIQRPEGLEEGFRLLWRGYSLGEHDDAVVDSLGWAYYQYGAFDEALALIQRANELGRRTPNAEILDHLGDVLWRLDRRQEAQEAWRQALRARPDLPRRSQLEAKLREGLPTPAPVRRPLPEVDTQSTPTERSQT